MLALPRDYGIEKTFVTHLYSTSYGRGRGPA